MGITEFRHKLACFDVPNSDEASIVARDYCLKFIVV
jgi:hypothetical protein